ncbi:leucine-rich repeat-containing protein 40 isoform X1 [Musca domestica]|uniref:Leucine-rich repeat-containing protein 40 isoform X1 n=1 Tax=Musca domestica TaxID=7370 RepID=A0A1I8MZJ6_MUSDO|nr:leucine-rich repeat-containing protein 40 isoform X1 [Musca domestica]XP_058982990.1 leucine-rich repeat-containing protein 40 isoform X1 [Musca domestica]
MRRHSQRPTLRNLNPVFHKREKSEDNTAVSDKLLKLAWKTGALNLSGRGLATVPDIVYDINASDKNAEVTLESLVAKEEDAWWNQLPLNNLDLSSNQLIQLSPKIENLCSLTTLTLHDNALTSIPKEIGKLEKLLRINLSRNRLKELPREFFTLPDLRYLNLSHNQFEELNPDISDLHMLEFLDVSNNELNALPGGIGFLVRLNTLLLAYNHIKELPPDLVNMRSLQKLDLMHNDLIALSEDMGSLRKLQCLYAQHNDIKELPDFDGCDLQELHVSNNFIEKIPKKLCSHLPHLKIVDLRDNKITEIPNEISLLQNLTRLDISNNSVSNLPYSLASLAHLVSLQVEGNPIKSIRRDILQCGTVRILKTLRDRQAGIEAAAKTSNSSSSLTGSMGADGLNSPRRGLSFEEENSIFPNRYKLHKTRCLTVTMQQLTEVPREVFETACNEHVNIVDLSKNRFTTLPEGLLEMKDCCSELVFANNLINHVPSFISQFTRLSLVNLSCNSLQDLPEEFGVLVTLRELNISNNRFETLPKCIYDLKGLEILLACDNRIKSIDATSDGLGALKRLAILDLRNNDIDHVPPILGNLKNITTLEIIGNPFKLPRHQTLERGTEAIMSYLRDRIPV